MGLKFRISLAALLCGPLLAEGLVRALDLRPVERPRSTGTVLRPSASPKLGFENSPLAWQELEYSRDQGSTPKRVRMQVNADGFRGPRVAQARAPGTWRIACVGDSHTFGWGVPDGETWPDHLRAILERRGQGRRPEVLNCGVNNYDVLQEYQALRRKVLPFRPDVVLWQFYVNDVNARGLEAEKRAPASRLLRWTHPERDGWLRVLRTRSKALDLGCDNLFRWSWKRELRRDSKPPFGAPAAAWARASECLKKADRICRKAGVEFGVILFPMLVREGEGFVSRESLSLVSRFCEESGIACLDLEPTLAVHEPRDLCVSPHDYHASGSAYRWAAERIISWMEQHEWMP
jgi:hypothetical protein